MFITKKQVSILNETEPEPCNNNDTDDLIKKAMEFNDIVDSMQQLNFENDECLEKIKKAISLYRTPTTSKKDYTDIKEMRDWPIWTRHCY